MSTLSHTPEKWTATRIRQLRHRAGLTQQALAVKLGLSMNTVARWETGGRLPHRKLSVPSLERLEHMLNEKDKHKLGGPTDDKHKKT